MSTTLVPRPDYMRRLQAFRDKTEIVKILSGVRRCGKSTLLEMFRSDLIASGVRPERTVTINLEDFGSYELRDPRNLHAYIESNLFEGELTYIFIDEVQHCADFPEVIESIRMRKLADIYLTGSNAALLSHEIATLLTGRYVEISMLPLSLSEYAFSMPTGISPERLYAQYISSSSFPYALELRDDPSALRGYLDSLYNSVVAKDISWRYNIADTKLLEDILRFVFDNIGNRLSARRIADTLTSAGRKTTSKTVEKYLAALETSFLMYAVPRFDIAGLELLKTLEKYYAVDIGLRNVLLGKRTPDTGHILENVVYLELLRRGGKVYSGKAGEREIDFVVLHGMSPTYYQVAATVRDEQTLKRELKPLDGIRDHYPKFLLTLDVDPEVEHNGIRQLNAIDWLLQNSDL